MSSSGSVGSRFDSELSAHDGTPWIGVHVLTEFIFCPRAGVIAFEEQRTDPGEDLDRAPRLDYLPDFVVALIEADLQKACNTLWNLVTWTPPAALLVWVAGLLVDRRLWLVLIPLGVWFLRHAARNVRIVLELSRRLRAAREATPREPDPESKQGQVVNWWGMMKCGFTPVEYEDPHEDADWKLVGKPWRVLHKGSLRIPVFRKRCGKEQLHPQHFARMAAYCHLIEIAEGGNAPYGIVLFGKGYDGLTVPNTEENRSTFQRALLNIRRLIEAVQTDGEKPDVPKQGRVCRECDRGRPRIYRKGITDTVLDGILLPAFCTRGEDWKHYHSTCGDRFGGVPLHDRAKEKRLC